MSDLSLALPALPALESTLERSRLQLPVSAYFDDDLHRREMELIFQHGPRYLGHELAVPEVGDHYALPQEGEEPVGDGLQGMVFSFTVFNGVDSLLKDTLTGQPILLTTSLVGYSAVA